MRQITEVLKRAWKNVVKPGNKVALAPSGVECLSCGQHAACWETENGIRVLRCLSCRHVLREGSYFEQRELLRILRAFEEIPAR